MHRVGRKNENDRDIHPPFKASVRDRIGGMDSVTMYRVFLGVIDLRDSEGTAVEAGRGLRS